MSVTISAVPFLLIFTISKGVIDYINMNNEIKDSMVLNENQNMHFEEQTLKQLNNKTFETTIMNKEVLMKTLEEHGAVNIIEKGEKIECDCEAFHIAFNKKSNNPYSMTITYNQEYKLKEFVEDIGNEYTLNAQEISYNQIKQRLEEKQLEIEEEEIYDDNTIVLTVNLE